MNLFTYGTLMFPEVWQRISIGIFPSQPAMLRGYSIYRVKDAVYPGIICCDTASGVRGVLYIDLDEDTLFELDTYESSFYERLLVNVTLESGEEVECHAYIVPPSRREMLTNEPWDADWFRLHELDKYLNG
jgi:gamma-glutamylcyclotransferase (GGCT)/AIG2-like uncharacterized protein YtfP